MSHSWEHKGVVFIGNSDLSGDVTIVMPDKERRYDVPGEALLDFIAHYLVGQKKAAMDDEEDPLVTLGVSRKTKVSRTDLVVQTIREISESEPAVREANLNSVANWIRTNWTPDEVEFEFLAARRRNRARRTSDFDTEARSPRWFALRAFSQGAR